MYHIILIMLYVTLQASFIQRSIQRVLFDERCLHASDITSSDMLFLERTHRLRVKHAAIWILHYLTWLLTFLVHIASKPT